MSIWKIDLFFIFVTLCIKALWTAGANYQQLTLQHPLYNIEVDGGTGDVYIGGENILVRATKELRLEKKVPTGPQKDNTDCLAPGVLPECKLPRILTNNRNKILLIDQGQQKLITCGSVYFGACQLRDLNSLSLLEEAKDKNVASNSPYPSVAFIAPGSDGGKDVMYVGSTWLKKYSVLLTQAAVASVSLQKNKLFAFVEEFFNDPVSLIEFKEPHEFIAKYIYGFSSGMFSYFIQVQQTSLKSGTYHTTIGRICHEDKRFVSYVEMPLVCRSNSGGDYNIAQSAFLTTPGELLASSFGNNGDTLFVAFGNSSLGSPNATRHSAVCVYSMSHVNQKLSENIKQCYKGPQNEGMAWAKRGGDDCTQRPEVDTTEPFCPGKVLSKSYPNYPIGGDKPAIGSAILLYDTAPLTAITAMPVKKYTALFLGTQHGHLLKASIEDGIYEDLVIDGSSAVTQLRFSADNQSLYTLSSKKVTMVPLQECDAYTSCDACVRRNDPFCGWCTLYKKCSEFSGCTGASLNPLRFARKTSGCIRFTSVTPDKIPVRTDTELEIVMANLPPRGRDQTYKCFVNGVEQLTTESPPGTFRCGIPKYGDLPPITGPKGSVLVNLELFSSESNKRFVGRMIAFYDCSQIKTCWDCSEGEFTCDWCLFRGVCSGNGSLECPAELVLARERRGPDRGCPRLQDDQPLYIPEGIQESFVLKARDLPVKQSGLDYKCTVEVDGSKFDTPATRDSDSQLTCSPQKYSYAQSVQEKQVTLSVWRGKHEVYQPGNVSVSLYKCHVGRPDCSICLVADERFKCGWCPRKGPCVVERGCKTSWISRNLKCNTVPNITEVWPGAGPTSGGTELEIRGVDLGKSFDDVKNSVAIGKYKCAVDPAKYEPARRIYCNTSASDQEVRDFVTVEIDGLKGRSPLEFSYQDPEVLDFEPKKGPESGGSTITITGKKLNTGRTIETFIGDTRCTLIDRMRVTDTTLQCVTAAAGPVRSRRAANVTDAPRSVTLAFDGYRPPSPAATFVFTPDPVVNGIDPMHSILSGGLKLKVTGINFASILEPKIFFKNPVNSSAAKAVESCQPRSDSELMCLSPNASLVGVKVGSANDSKVTVGFILDGVPGLEDVTRISIKRDPVLTKFEDGVKEVTRENLILEGEHLGSVTKRDVRVTVQGVQCNITSMAENQIVCHSPEQSQVPEVEEELYVVEVVIGNRKYNPGKMKYFKLDDKGLTMWMIIGIAAGGAVILIALLVLICLYCRKRKQQRKSIQNYENRMINLESKVAKECREAFAELQTDMTDLTNNMSAAGMPFLPFRQFALHVLFPGSEDHPIMRRRECGHNPEKESGLRQFSQMLNNKDFLLVFIRTLETQLSFQMKDRCNVASLLIVALQGKMEYVTDILRHLLCDLIRKSVAKSHPKLLLRRTESVAEKLLTNWLAFCMYNFMQTEAGEPLFMLFKAIKTQTEKGPIDGLTGDARYSLSEDKLLRQTTEYKELTVQVKYEDQEAPFTVVLLDCDTISQAKDKILDVVFKNRPFSEHPDKDTLQLEWLRINERTQALRDDDSSSIIEGQWRKFNTLQHYKVPDGALLQLVSRQSYFYSSTDSVHRSRRNLPRVGFSPSSYTPIMAEDGTEAGGKIYHLVKSAEYVHERGDDSRHSKLLSEIYLTRLLATKGTLQQFVDRLFATVFIRRGTPIPIAIKFLFDLLDEQARELNLTDPEVLHTWKNNSLPLRFWINMIKNPNFIFDVKKPGIVDSCLSVIAQLFMDACSVSEHKLGKDSPSNKLLYAKELPAYRQRVESFYNDIQKSRTYSTKELSEYFAELSTTYGREFSSESALEELYEYVLKYQDQLQDALEEDGQEAQTSKIEMVIALMTDDLV